MWHDDEWMKKNIPTISEFDYSNIDSLAKFEGTHPIVMLERIKKMNWKFSFDPTRKNSSHSTAGRILYSIEKMFGYRIGEYKNYRLI